MFKVNEYVDSIAQKIISVNDEIWRFAEKGLKEIKSASVLVKVLKDEGFKVSEGVADMPTAIVASYGSGKPIIGILAEYDALSGLSQDAVPYKKPLEEGASGHGCGHNMLGAGALGACLAVKTAIDSKIVNGTIRFYGCPAEETFNAKGYMVKAGLFDDVDIALTWHPSSLTAVQAASSLAINSVSFEFHGRTAHAAGDPHNGRSALDAVELMNVASNYLREHVPTTSRIHYSITNGGGEPNIVPDKAEVWYYIRAPRRDTVEEIFQRILKIAKGACLMTETDFDYEFIDGTYNLLYNETVGQVLYESLLEAKAPQFDNNDIDFAEKISESYPVSYRESVIEKLPNTLQDIKKDLMNKHLCDVILPTYDKGEIGMGSTDVSDVSWYVPTAQFRMATYPIGTPGHSWQLAASAGMSIGHKGVIAASKTLALASIKFMQDPMLISKAKEEFKNLTEANPYECPLPDGLKPPFHKIG